jgi:predicted P-loop ATPase/GTPase
MRIKDINLFEGLALMSPEEQVEEMRRIAILAVEKKFNSINQKVFNRDDLFRIADECMADIERNQDGSF